MTKSAPMQGVMRGRLRAQGYDGQVIFNSLEFRVPGLAKAEAKKKLPEWLARECAAAIEKDVRILKPTCIVIQDEAVLQIIAGKKVTLARARGSLYWYSGVKERAPVPCIGVNAWIATKLLREGPYELGRDLGKISRWARHRAERNPPFDFSLAKTVADIRMFRLRCESEALFIATDRETLNGFITCTGYTAYMKNGTTRTLTIPFFSPLVSNGAYWESHEIEVAAWEEVRKLHASPILKVLQNGTYDSAYDCLFNVPLENYWLDTSHLGHAMSCELPKALDKQASYYLDEYTYWKDESKGFKEDALGATAGAVNAYWRYNGLDTYYTALLFAKQANAIVKMPWALKNYNEEIHLALGPCFGMSLRGMLVDEVRHMQLMEKQRAKADAGAQDLCELTGEADFNPYSSSDVAWFLYDVLGAKKTRLQTANSKLGARSTDEKILRLMLEQGNFFIKNFIQRLLAAKKPRGVLSKYGKFERFAWKNGRFLSWHSAAGTDTWRLNSGNSQFWTGTNAQNFQPFMEEVFIADPDYAFVCFDYSASDDWFIAFESNDPDKKATLRSKDVHSWHCHKLFGLDYEEVKRGKKANEEWVTHAITGVRQIAKKINHGRNFLMGGGMMYTVMGRDTAIAAARLLGIPRPEAANDAQLLQVTTELCDRYDDPRRGMYKRIRPWQDELMEIVKHNGGLLTNSFGMTRRFLRDPNEHRTKREAASFIGQSGTSGNVNRAANEIWYGPERIDDGKYCRMIRQVHDDLRFLIHKDVFHEKIAQIKRVMEAPLTIKGDTFFVPVEIKCGLTEGKRVLEYRPDMTWEELEAHEMKTFGPRTVLDKNVYSNVAALAALDFDMPAPAPKPLVLPSVKLSVATTIEISTDDFAGITGDELDLSSMFEDEDDASIDDME